jgi:phosphonate transport system substrate-binding protein
MFKKILKVACVASVLTVGLIAKEGYDFGVISTVSPTEDAKKLAPLLSYLSKEVGQKVSFKTGKNYTDTIEKFSSGEFEIGFIGPSPYIIATKKEKNLEILAGVETKGKPFFHGVIVARKDNADINSVADLKGKKFAFGSKESTLSFYTPAKALLDANVKASLAGFEFLGKHDIVAQNVVAKKFDAGGIQESVAAKYAEHLKVIQKSEPMYDFMIVAHKNLSPEVKAKFKAALLKLKDPAILEAIKPGATGFVETNEKNYDNLRAMMDQVDAVFAK